MRRAATILGLVTLASLAGCGPRSVALDEGSAAAPVPPVRGVMRQKLVHAQSVLAGLARSDYAAIERHALRLHDLSEEAEWLVHDTVTYLVLSDEFREQTRRMAASAAAEDLEGATARYVEMVDVCVRCHTHLRQERLIKDFPEKVSLVPAGVPARSRRG